MQIDAMDWVRLQNTPRVVGDSGLQNRVETEMRCITSGNTPGACALAVGKNCDFINCDSGWKATLMVDQNYKDQCGIEIWVGEDWRYNVWGYNPSPLYRDYGLITRLTNESGEICDCETCSITLSLGRDAEGEIFFSVKAENNPTIWTFDNLFNHTLLNAEINSVHLAVDQAVSVNGFYNTNEVNHSWGGCGNNGNQTIHYDAIAQYNYVDLYDETGVKTEYSDSFQDNNLSNGGWVQWGGIPGVCQPNDAQWLTWDNRCLAYIDYPPEYYDPPFRYINDGSIHGHSFRREHPDMCSFWYGMNNWIFEVCGDPHTNCGTYSDNFCVYTYKGPMWNPPEYWNCDTDSTHTPEPWCVGDMNSCFGTVSLVNIGDCDEDWELQTQTSQCFSNGSMYEAVTYFDNNYCGTKDLLPPDNGTVTELRCDYKTGKGGGDWPPPPGITPPKVEVPGGTEKGYFDFGGMYEQFRFAWEALLTDPLKAAGLAADAIITHPKELFSMIGIFLLLLFLNKERKKKGRRR